MDVLWLGFVRLPSLLACDPWLELARQGKWVSAIIAIFWVAIEINLGCPIFGLPVQGVCGGGAHQWPDRQGFERKHA